METTGPNSPIGGQLGCVLVTVKAIMLRVEASFTLSSFCKVFFISPHKQEPVFK